jgi:hypothetical protein
MTAPADIYNPMESVLRTVTRDPITFRARDIRPGEEVESIWDELHAEGSTFVFGPVTINGPGEFEDKSTNQQQMWDTFYNESDAAEDLVIFGEDQESGAVKQFKGISNSITKLEQGGPTMARFLMDLDPDEDIVFEELAPLALQVRMIVHDRELKDEERGSDDEWESAEDEDEELKAEADGDDSDSDDNDAFRSAIKKVKDGVDEAQHTQEAILMKKMQRIFDKLDGPLWDTGVDELLEAAEKPLDRKATVGRDESKCRTLIQSWIPGIARNLGPGKNTEEEFRRHIDRERAVGMWMIGFSRPANARQTSKRRIICLRMELNLKNSIANPPSYRSRLRSMSCQIWPNRAMLFSPLAS